MSRQYGLVVFGASGFTGKFVVEEIVKTLKKLNADEKFTWAVAGRSAKKLDEILEEVSQFTGSDVKNTPKIIADVADMQSLQDMAKVAKVVLNCVGPYRFFGEQVVQACIIEGAHHVDLSGEPQFLEKTQLLYHKDAEEKGVYVIGACGFDSIPADCGTMFLEQNFDGDLNSVEEYFEIENETGKKATIHYGTWQSAIHGIAHAKELRPLRQQLFPEPLPKPRFKVPQRGVLHNSEVVSGWCLPFPGSDRSIIQRTQRYDYAKYGKRPVQVQAYVKMGSLISSILLMTAAVFFGVLAQFRIGRYLLETFPRLFSAGFVNHEGPSREAADGLKFTFTLVGEGWKDRLSEGTDQHTDKPDKKLKVKVRGQNPGYGATCTCIVQAAITLLFESDKMPSKGGVLTPGSAFAQTNLIDRLNKFGVTFTVEE